ncbi:MAG: beta strand repeat-containing protein, partial [Ferruginibacter sp.]
TTTSTSPDIDFHIDNFRIATPCVAPTTQATSASTTLGSSFISGSFTAAAAPGAYGYLIVRTDGTATPTNPVNGTSYTAGASALGGVIIASGTGTTFNNTGLTASTQYTYTVFAYNAVTCPGGPTYNTTTPLSVTASTLAGQLITSTTTGGLWSQTTTWDGGVLPSANDFVTIKDGATVTIDMAAVAKTVTVGEGTSGILIYQATPAASLTVGTDVTIATGGTFQTAATGTVLTHTLFLGGSLVNNGTLDFSTNANTAGGTISFTGTTAANFTLGASSTTDLRQSNGVTVVKSTSSLTFTPGGTLTVAGANTAGFLTLTSGTFEIAGTNTFSNPLFNTNAYTIPAAATLRLNNPNATIVALGSTPLVLGTLRITSGTMNVGTGTGNSLDFGTTTTAANFNMEGGALNVAGRFNVATAASLINYTQSGGTVTVNTVGNASTTLASFDLGTGASSENISGGTIIVRLAGSGGSGPRDYRNSGTGTQSITGGTLQLGDALSGAVKNYQLTGQLPSLVISNTSAAHNATLVGDVVVNGNVTIPATSTLSMAAFNLTVAGNSISNPGNISNSGTINITSATGVNRLLFNGTFGQQTYSGGVLGSSATPIAGISFSNTAGVNFASGSIVTNRLNLFTGAVTGAANITVGNGANTQTIQRGSNAANVAGSLDVSPTFNVASLSLIYSPSNAAITTGFEIPATRTANIFTIYNANGVVLAGGNLSVGSLALNAGNLTTTSSNLVTVTGTTTTSVSNKYVSAAGATSSGTNITVGSTVGLVAGMPVTVTAGTGAFPSGTTVASVTSSTVFVASQAPTVALSASAVVTGGGVNYVNGPLAITLPASRATGSTYSFPIGKGQLNTLDLVNPITTAGGTVVLQSEVFDADVQGAGGAAFATLNTNRYWSSSIVSGAANFTSSAIRLTETTPAINQASDAIAFSATNNPGDPYANIGGNFNVTDPANTITSDVITGTGFGYFVIGQKADPMTLVSSTTLQTYTSAAGATSSGSTITVGSTAYLGIGMTVLSSGGTGAFVANTKVANILSATQFTVTTPPTTALSGANNVIRARYTDSTVTTGTDRVVTAIRINTINSASPLPVTQFNFTNTSTGDLTKYTNAKLYYTGTSNVFSTTTQYGNTLTGEVPATFVISADASNTLAPGTNYFWLTYDVEAGATINSTIDAAVTGFDVDYTTVSAANNISAAELALGDAAGNRVVKEVLNGTYLVGAGNPYTTITAAVTDLNTFGVSGPVNFKLTDATYSTNETFPITINQFTGSSSTNTVTISPNTGVTAAVTGTAASAIFVLNGADNVIIEGSNSPLTNSVCPAVASTRDLTITNNSTSTSSAVLWLQTATGANAAGGNIVRNTNIVGNASTTTLVGIGSGSTTISISSLGTANNNNRFENNTVSKVQYGIYSQGASAANKNSGTVIAQNVLNNTTPNNIGLMGILVGFDDNITVTGNLVGNMTSTSDIHGISIGNGTSIAAGTAAGNQVSNATITFNVVGPVTGGGTNSAIGIGLGASTSGTNTIANNRVFGILANPTGGDYVAGISLQGGVGSTNNVYHNTVRLTGTAITGTASASTFAALAINTSTAPVVNINNNLLVNTVNGNTGATSRFAGIALQYSSVLGNYANLVSNNNNIYSVGATIGTSVFAITGGINGTTRATLAAWTTETGRDGASQTVNPAFVSASDLHLSGSNSINTVLATGGTPLASVTTDIDCEARSASTPSIGADEFAILTVVDAGVTSIILPSTLCGGSTSVSAVVKNIGTSTINSFNVGWEVNGVAQTSPATFNITLAPNEETTVVLGNYDFVVGTTYSITAATGSPNGGADGVPGNDGTTRTGIQTGMTGTYTVGTGGTYTTLTAAIADYNTRSICGPIVFSLIGTTFTTGETYPITINANAAASAVNTLTIKPAVGVTPTITGSSTTAILKINGADYVTIDGSNTVGGTTKDLIIVNTASSGSVVWIASTASTGATNNTIQYTNIRGNSSSSTTYGVLVSGATAAAAAEVSNTNTVVSNNVITKLQNGIYAFGNATTPDAGWVFNSNTLGSTTAADKLGLRGISVLNATGVNVNNNQITGVTTSTSSTSSGLFFGSAIVGGKATGNNITDVKNTSSSGFGSNGIYLSSTTTASALEISNNLISNVASYGYLGSWGVADNGYGIIITSGGGYKIYYNSVNLATNQTASSGQTAAINIASGVVGLDIRNNIFSNTQTIGTRYAIYSGAVNTAFTDINYNDYNAAGGSLGFLGGAQNTITAWRTATGKDVNSVNIAPVFTSASDPHLVVLSNISLNNLGTPITGVTTDYDGDTRNATNPDLGADEFTPPACTGTNAGTIAPVSAGLCVGATTTLTATGASAGVGVLYQWQVATTSGGTLADVVGGTGATTTVYTIPNNLAAGTYYYKLKVTCTALSDGFSAEVPVSISVKPTVTASSNTPICEGGTVSMTGNVTGTATSYTWTGPNSFSSSVQNPTIISATTAAAGTYTFTALNNGCASTSATTVVAVNAAPAEITANDYSICQNATVGVGEGLIVSSTVVSGFSGSVAATPTFVRSSGGTTYSAGTGNFGYQTHTFTVSATGTYTFNQCAPSYDGHASIYTAPFNPASPATNFLEANDDTNGTPSCTSGTNSGSDARFTRTFTAGVSYVLVSTVFTAGEVGAYEWTFSGPGDVISATPDANIRWYTQETGGTQIGVGATFNPVGVANSGLANTSTVGTTTYYVANNNGTCESARTPVSFTVTANIWTGNTSTVWSTATNWTCGTPTSTSSVVIPNTSNKPVLDGNVTVAGLELQAGSTLSLNANNFTVNGALAGTGTITGSTASNLTFGGTGGTVNFTTNAQAIKNLTVNSPAVVTLGTTLEITPAALAANNGTVIVNSGATLNSNGNLVIKSNANGTARVGVSAGTINGEVTVERYISNNNGTRAWRLLSVPTKGTSQSFKASWKENAATINDNPNPGYGTIITAGSQNIAWSPNGFDGQQTSASILKYTEATAAWSEQSSLMVSNETTAGYFLYIRGDRSVLPSTSSTAAGSTTLRTKGLLYQHDQAEVSVASGKFGLIGNIFASAIDFTGLTRSSSISNTYWVWDPKLAAGNVLGAYQTFTGTAPFDFKPLIPGGSYTTGVRNTVIEAGQAFFVKAGAGAGTVTIPESAKTDGVNGVFRPLSGPIPTLRTTVYGINGGSSNYLADVNYVTFDAAFSNAVDGDDVVKLSNSNENIAVKRDNVNLIVEARQPIANNDSILLSMWNMRPQQYQFEFIGENMATTGATAFLVDRFLNTTTPINLLSPSTVNFTVTAAAGSSNPDRFRIVFNAAAPVPVTFTNINAYSKNAGVQVDWKVAGEYAIDKYEVERSADGRNFTATGTVRATGNNGASVNYGWFDANPAPGTNFYRIKSIGLNGEVKFTQVVKVTLGSVKPAITVSPNPIQGNVMNVQFKNVEKGRYNLRLINAAGQVLYTNTADLLGGNSTQVYRLPVVITGGTYDLEVISAEGTRFVQKVFINTNN